MSTEPIGIVAGLQAKREAVVANLSPAAKHAAFPTVYARPLPIPSEASQLREELRKARAELGETKRENQDLRNTIVALQAKVDTPSEILLARIAQRRNSPAEIIAAYLAELNRLRVEAGAAEYTRDHLVSPRRARAFTAPRHVCIWLLRALCMHYSLPMLGRLMGGRDHTSCMHACERAEHWMLVDPMLKQAADAVLLRFGAPVEKAAGEP